jgi:hypothetical protein
VDFFDSENKSEQSELFFGAGFKHFRTEQSSGAKKKLDQRDGIWLGKKS